MAEKTERRAPRRYDRQLPPIGTVLTHEFRGRGGKRVVATVVEAQGFPEGRSVRLDGKLYRSLSAAAASLTGRPTNGWTFWNW